MKSLPAIFSLILLVAPSNKASAYDSNTDHLNEIEKRINDILSHADDFNELDRLEVRIEGCQISWRREFISRQCRHDWTVHAWSYLLNIDELYFRERLSPIWRSALTPLPAYTGEYEVDFTVSSLLQSLEDVQNLDLNNGRSADISEYCDGSIAAGINQERYRTALVEEVDEEFEALFGEVAEINGCRDPRRLPSFWDRWPFQ